MVRKAEPDQSCSGQDPSAQYKAKTDGAGFSQTADGQDAQIKEAANNHVQQEQPKPVGEKMTVAIQRPKKSRIAGENEMQYISHDRIHQRHDSGDKDKQGKSCQENISACKSILNQHLKIFFESQSSQNADINKGIQFQTVGAYIFKTSGAHSNDQTDQGNDQILNQIKDPDIPEGCETFILNGSGKFFHGSYPLSEVSLTKSFCRFMEENCRLEPDGRGVFSPRI